MFLISGDGSVSLLMLIDDSVVRANAQQKSVQTLINCSKIYTDALYIMPLTQRLKLTITFQFITKYNVLC